MYRSFRVIRSPSQAGSAGDTPQAASTAAGNLAGWAVARITVGVAEARAYLGAGAVAVGVGSPLVGDAASGGDLDALAARAASFRALAEEFQA